MAGSEFNDNAQKTENGKKFPEASYRALAQWWVDQLPSPNKIGPTRNELDNCDSEAMLFGVLLAADTRAEYSITQEQRSAFSDALISEMKKIPSDRTLIVSFDYHADSILSAALTAAGLPDSMSIFPMKTFSNIDCDGVVKVRGTDGQWKTLNTSTAKSVANAKIQGNNP